MGVGDARVTGRVVRLWDEPRGAFSIYEPAQVGCGGGRRRTSASSLHYDCEVAMNGGFFAIDHSSAFCLNSVVSDARLVQTQAQLPSPQRHRRGEDGGEAADWREDWGGDAAVGEPPLSSSSPPPSSDASTVWSAAAASTAAGAAAAASAASSYAHSNVHFGLTDDGRYFIGHVDEAFMQRHTGDSGGASDELDWRFVQLVSGLVWLVKAGRVHVNDSWWGEEDQSTPIAQSTPPASRAAPSTSFIASVSARTAIGHDSGGHLTLVVVDGKTGVSGVSLEEMAELCIRLGLVNAINLDGGGSATLTQRHLLINTPSDDDPTACSSRTASTLETCEREVTTIACIHRFGLNRSRWEGNRVEQRAAELSQPLPLPHPAPSSASTSGAGGARGVVQEGWQRWASMPMLSLVDALLLLLLVLLLCGVWWWWCSVSAWSVRGGGGRGSAALRWCAPLWLRSRRARLDSGLWDRSEMEEEELEDGVEVVEVDVADTAEEEEEEEAVDLLAEAERTTKRGCAAEEGEAAERGGGAVSHLPN